MPIYRLTFRVRSCAIRSRTIRARKLANGAVEEDCESMGYFLVLDPGGLAFALGAEAPGFAPGDEVELILRRKETIV